MKTFRNFLIGALAALGVIFLVLWFLPDYERNPVHSHALTGSGKPAGFAREESGGQESEEQESGDQEAGEPVEVSTSQIRPIATNTAATSATVLIYMNGSDLESDSGEATEDIGEMLDSGIGRNVNVIIQTMGTRRWQEYGISSRTAQRYRLDRGRLELVQDSLGQLDCTTADTLSDFIDFGKRNYPADRYIFIFWDHGGGPVYGFGYDEWQNEEDALTLDEMYEAFSRHTDIRFDLIGMDCCIMGSLETCCAFSSFCDYMALSEDFESGLGWAYTGWMGELEANPGISTPVLGKSIIDQMIEANERDYGGDSSTMALIDEASVPRLYVAWRNFAYDNEAELLGSNYSRKHKAKGRSSFWDLWSSDGSDVTLSDYCISDLMALVESVGEADELTEALKAALSASVVYFGHTRDTNELTGLAVTLPYGDRALYAQLREVYAGCGFEEEYIEWLGKFVNASGSSNYNNYSSFENSWDGWGSYDTHYDWDNWEYAGELIGRSRYK